MLNGKNILGIIPARGGSKRLPRKNLLDLAGKPLLSWTIEASMKSKFIDSILVTSDDSEILSIAEKHHVKTIKRPRNISGDFATTISVIEHALEQTTTHYDYFVLLQPTSPLRNEKHIDEAIIALNKYGAEAIISVTKSEHCPLWSNTLETDMNMKNFIKPSNSNIRSQDLPQYYRLNGAIYLVKIKSFIQQKNIFLNSNVYAYEMERYHSVDIDDEIDFAVAEQLIKNQQNKK